MQRLAHQVAGWRAAEALPDRAAVAAIAALSAVLWAVIVRLALWWLAAVGG
jgi:hypothetical protein